MKARHLSDALAQECLNALAKQRHDKWALCFEVLIRSGMRGHELTRVSLEDLDLKRGTITVHAAKHSNDRTVPVDLKCLEAVALYLKSGTAAWQGYEAEVFKASLRRYWVQWRVQNLGSGLGHCSLHGLRASFAVRVYKGAGRDLLLVQELLGHKRVENTTKYVRLVQAEERQKEILNVFKIKKVRK